MDHFSGKGTVLLTLRIAFAKSASSSKIYLEPTGDLLFFSGTAAAVEEQAFPPFYILGLWMYFFSFTGITIMKQIFSHGNYFRRRILQGTEWAWYYTEYIGTTKFNKQLNLSI